MLCIIFLLATLVIYTKDAPPHPPFCFLTFPKVLLVLRVIFLIKAINFFLVKEARF